MYLASHTKYYGKYISYRPNCKVSVWVFCGRSFDKWPLFVSLKKKIHEGWQLNFYIMYFVITTTKNPASLHISNHCGSVWSIIIRGKNCIFWACFFSNFGYNCASGLRREPGKVISDHVGKNAWSAESVYLVEGL